MTIASQPCNYGESCEYPLVAMNAEGDLQAVLKQPEMPVLKGRFFQILQNVSLSARCVRGQALLATFFVDFGVSWMKQAISGLMFLWLKSCCSRDLKAGLKNCYRCSVEK